mgnify:CR=1 FL=1
MRVRSVVTFFIAATAFSTFAVLPSMAQQPSTMTPYGQQPLQPAPVLQPAPQLAPAQNIRQPVQAPATGAQNTNAAAPQQQQIQPGMPMQQLVPVMVMPPMQQLVPVGQQPVVPQTPAAPAAAPAEQPAPAEAQDEEKQTEEEPVSVEASAATIPTPMPEMSADSILKQTNKGIDMELKPDLVGGVGEDADANNIESGLSALQQEEPLSYEDQLRIRTKEIEQQAQSRAFEQSKRATFPLETYQIRELLRKLKETQEAIQTPVRTPPKPQNVIKTISVDPSVKSETINLAVGNVTALNIVDMTGAPWPIVDIAFGGQFDVKAPDPGGSILRITPLRDFARGNMVIRLLQMTTPITFTLQAGGSVVNYRFDARIPQYGPNARMPIIEEGIKAVAGDAVVNSVLEGVPPAGSEKLQVDGVDLRTSAYRINGSLYVRTPLTLLSPAWRGSATSADGMNVYVLAEAPVLLLSDQGKLTRARLSVPKEKE